MIKVISIKNIKPYLVTLKFSTGEIKILDALTLIQNAPKTVNKEKILNKDFFKTAKIGEFGQLYWEAAAYMKDENNNLITCEFDVSSEYLYVHALSVK